MKAYSAELETTQNYLANSVWLDGLNAQEVVEALADDLADEMGHARKLAKRLKQLGCCPPGSQALERTQTYLQPAADSTDLRHVVLGVIKAEEEAVQTYQAIIIACGHRDPVTADMAVRILEEEEGHKCLFEGFLRGMDSSN
jgi:bacterioferritin